MGGDPAGSASPPGSAFQAPAPDTLAALLTLPQSQAWLPAGVPRGVPVAHKSGQLPGVRHDAGVVYGPGGPFVLVVLTEGLADQGAGEATIAALARRVYDYFN